MHHCEKMSFFCPQTLTGKLSLDPVGELPTFRPLIAHPWKKSCGRPWERRSSNFRFGG